MTNINQENVKKAVGLVCHDCGCQHFFTDNTRKGKNQIIRSRRCRNCGKRVTTCEKVVK